MMQLPNLIGNVNDVVFAPRHIAKPSRRVRRALERKRNKHKPTEITLFGGCGGWNEGSKNWFDTKLMIDSDKHSCQTFRANNPDVIIEQQDLFEYNGEAALKRLGMRKGEIDLLHSSAPCTGNSINNPNRSVDLKVNELLWKITPQFIHDTSPRIFTIENTTGLLGGDLLPLYFKMEKELNRLLPDYDWDFRKLNALDYCQSEGGDCPTERLRFIVIGVRYDVLAKSLGITVEELSNKLKEMKEAVAMKNCEGKVTALDENGRGCSLITFPEPTTKDYTALYADKIEPELAWIYSGQRFPESKKKRAALHFMNTIMKTQNIKVTTLAEPRLKRWLSKKQLLRFQGFRPDFLIDGSLSKIQARIGNSVPPPLAYCICKHIINTYLR